jgi:hypothetical protein
MTRLRRLPIFALLLTLVVALSALFPADAIRNAVDYSAIGDARLDRSIGYVVLGPVSGMFDAMTLFTVGQIIAFTLWAVAAYIAIRIWRRIDAPVPILREARNAAIAFVILIAIYGAAVILPRPMARLVITRLDVIAADFHSHTQASHDGRTGWTAADVRDWHTDGGYQIAYITDHRSFEGVRAGLRLDSAMVGQEGTTLLPGIEAFYHGEHVNVLNAGARFRGLTTPDLVSVDSSALALSSLIAGVEPVLIETIPGNLDAVLPHHGPQTSGVRAIELVAGSPRGMTQTKRDHDRIVRMADSLNLALVTGSDNHGWGRTAPGWTLLRIPGVWRTYRPDSLANLIDDIIRISGRRGTLVVERRTAPSSQGALVVAGPLVLWTVLRTSTSAERVAWLGWIWVPAAIMWLRRRRSEGSE